MTLHEVARNGDIRVCHSGADLSREALYTRYCAAPRPREPVHEPRLIHSMMLAAWLGRLIDPLPHPGRKAAPKHPH